MIQSDLGGHTITVRRLYAAAPQTVFNAFLDPEIAKRWMCGPGTQVSEYCLEPFVGGRFKLVMQGSRQSWPHEGTVEAYEPPKHLVFTWRSPSTQDRDSRVSITLEQVSAGVTSLTLMHSLLPPNYPAFDQGWHELLVELGRLLTPKPC